MSSRRRLLPLALTREGFYYLAVLSVVLVASLLREINLMLILSSLMLGPLVLNCLAVVITLRRLTIRRRIPKSALAGESLTVELLVANQRRRTDSWLVLAEDRWRRQSADKGATTGVVGIPHIAAGQTARATYRFIPLVRGRYELGPVYLTTHFPLGFLRRTIVVDRRDSVLVYPRVGRSTMNWRRRWQEAAQEGQQGSGRRSSSQGDFYGLRDWRPGDARRAIHWRTSARRGSLVARQFDQPRRQDLAIVLDLLQPELDSNSAREAVEHAVSFVATLVSEACRQGDARLTLWIVGATIELRCGMASSALAEQALSQLALAEPALAHAGKWTQMTARATQQPLPSQSAGAAVVVVGARPRGYPASESSAIVAAIFSRAARIIEVNASEAEMADYVEFDS